jgi:WD40 repeat protein
LVAGGAAGLIKVWDAKTLAPLGEFGPTPAAVRSLAISGDGNLLASVSPNLPPSANQPFSVLLWDLKTNNPLQSIEHPRPDFGSTVIAFLPDGERLLSAQDRTLRVIDVRQGMIVKTVDLPDLPRTIGSVALDPDGNRLATGAFEAKLRLLNTRDWKQLLSWDAHDKPAPPRRGVSTVSFSPDGKYLLSGGLDGAVCVWDARDGRLLLELDGRGGSTSGWVTGVSTTPDNRWLAATHFGGTATVWRLSREGK